MTSLSHHARSLGRYVDLSICEDTISYIYENFTEKDISSFLRIEK